MREMFSDCENGSLEESAKRLLRPERDRTAEVPANRQEKVARGVTADRTDLPSGSTDGTWLSLPRATTAFTSVASEVKSVHCGARSSRSEERVMRSR